jgi:hypothetical protein
MVWVYDSPLNASEQRVYKVLKRKLKEEDIAKTTVKILSLYSFLKSHKFSSPKQLQEAAFLDKGKSIPVFTDEQAKSVLKSLKKKGGASKYPFTDHVTKKGLDYATTLVPEGVKGTVQSVYDLALQFGYGIDEVANFCQLTGLDITSDSVGGQIIQVTKLPNNLPLNSIFATQFFDEQVVGYILMEDGFYLLQENDFKILL